MTIYWISYEVQKESQENLWPIAIFSNFFCLRHQCLKTVLEKSVPNGTIQIWLGLKECAFFWKVRAFFQKNAHSFKKSACPYLVIHIVQYVHTQVDHLCFVPQSAMKTILPWLLCIHPYSMEPNVRSYRNNCYDLKGLRICSFTHSLLGLF